LLLLIGTFFWETQRNIGTRNMAAALGKAPREEPDTFTYQDFQSPWQPGSHIHCPYR
jgi:hypothetical protein